METLRADLAIIGGGLGGCAAAEAACGLGLEVVMTEEGARLGGQMTASAVPPDEHPWIERFGASRRYRTLREEIRGYYRAHLPLTGSARANPELNPGNGWVSRLCHDPRVSEAVLMQRLARFRLGGRLRLLRLHRPIGARVRHARVQSLVVRSERSGHELELQAELFIDATELGDLLPIAEVEHVFGQESRGETGEPHAPERANPMAQQAFTICFALEHRPGEHHTIPRPETYDFWREVRPSCWPGKLLDWTVPWPQTGAPLTRVLFGEPAELPLWTYRRILDRENFEPGFTLGDVTVVDWPQNDYWLGPLIGVSEAERERHLAAARELSLSLLYWLQTEAPRPEGGCGYPELHLRPDVVESEGGLAVLPYVREARRLKAQAVVREQDIAHPLRSSGPALFEDSVGIGCYRIDLHPRTSGEGYFDIGCWPFQIPLGAMIPVRVENLLAGGKCLGVTHITNGAYRVHHVEWAVGEAAGTVAAFCHERGLLPAQVRARVDSLAELQRLLEAQGVPLAWPELTPL